MYNYILLYSRCFVEILSNKGLESMVKKNLLDISDSRDIYDKVKCDNNCVTLKLLETILLGTVYLERF